MHIRRDGSIAEGARFFAAHIRSQGRLIYDQVSDWLEQGQAEGFEPGPAIAEQILALKAITEARQRNNFV